MFPAGQGAEPAIVSAPGVAETTRARPNPGRGLAMQSVPRKRPHNFSDLRGRKFGRLTVQSNESTKVGRYLWYLALCDCGTLRTFRGQSLTRGGAKSCGCSRTTRPRRIDIGSREVAKFWSRVEIRGADECWPWRLVPATNGYGLFYVKTGQRYWAHRFALASATCGFSPGGEIATPFHCLHSCDNRVCCNARHLRWGTNDENIADMIARGRQSKGPTHMSALRPWSVSKGDEHCHAKLTAEAVVEIRKSPLTRAALAEKFNVSPTTISDARARRTWKHVA